MYHERYSVRFNARKIINHFGGPDAAVEALKTVGVVAKSKTLQRQRERGNMTADMVACLALASVKLGHPIDLYDCLLTNQKDLQ